MQVLRLFPRAPRLLLIFSLAVSPLLSTLHAGTAVAAPDMTAAHDMVAGGDAVHQHALPAASGKQHQVSSGCTQHNACFGQCCSGCAHCVGALMSVLVVPSSPHPVLAAREPQLFPRAFISLYERPPRLLSA